MHFAPVEDLRGVTQTSLPWKESATAATAPQQLFPPTSALRVSPSVSQPQIKLEQHFAAFLDFHQKKKKNNNNNNKGTRMRVGEIVERHEIDLANDSPLTTQLIS